MIEYNSVWPTLVCSAVLLGLAATPLLRGADTPPGITTKRIVTLDGMRGFLAMAVVFHHAAIYHEVVAHGYWSAPNDQFYRLLGPVGVSLFFMITGFLFWSQLLRMSGRPSWIALYTGRFFRIGPLYLVATLAVFSIVLAHTGFAVRTEPRLLLTQLAHWSSMGIAGTGALNGYAGASRLLADVTWTLQYEWRFYALLPILAFFTGRRVHLPFVLTAMLACQIYLHTLASNSLDDHWTAVMLFLLGMLCGSLAHEHWLVKIPDALGSVLVVAMLVSVFLFAKLPRELWVQVALGAVLYLVLSGASVFGLLRTYAALRLGDISYGIYLLQGLVLAAVFRSHFGRLHDIHSALEHWLLTLTVMICLIVLATLTHVLVERPGILMGKRVSTSLKSVLGSW